MQHAKTFVMASLPAPAPAPARGPTRAPAPAPPSAPSSAPPPIPPIPPDDPPTAGPPTAGLSSAGPPSAGPEGRETDGLFEAMQGSVRRQLLLALCTAGGAHVSALRARLGIGRTLASRHLNILKVRGFVLDQREGQQVRYTAVPDRVRYEVHGDRYALTIISPSGQGLTLFGPVTEATALARPVSPDISSAARVAAADSAD